MDPGYPGQGYEPARSDLRQKQENLNQSYNLETHPSQQGYSPAPPYTGTPQTAMTTNTVVVSSQPTATTIVTTPQQDHSAIAIVALVLSILGLLCCGVYIIFLICLIPALILSILAVASPRESNASTFSGISIVLTIVGSASCICAYVIAGIVVGVEVAAIASSSYSYSYNNCYYYYYSGYQCYYY